MITRFTVAAFAAAMLFLDPIAAAGATNRAFTVLHHERLHDLRVEHRVTRNDAGAHGDRAARLAFRALGRDFRLGLEPNDRLLASLAPDDRALPAGLELYRGTLDDAAGTWARVGVLRGEIHALVWDGAELYAIEPAARVADRLADGDRDAGGYVAFRLSDVQSAFEDVVVASGRAAATPFAASGALPPTASASGPTRRIDIGLVADAEFLARNPDAQAEMLLRANYVDGIYSEQLGLQINVTEIVTGFGPSSAPASTDPAKMLASVADLRAADPALRSQALVHLFTGRELDGNVVGIAYLDGVCDVSAGAGLTQTSASAAWDALITAHEIGHNLGARHDAEDGSPCESTPPGYLMSPQLSGNEELSSCSVQHIESLLAHASCVGHAFAGDVRVTIDAAATALVGDDVPVRVSVDNLGSETSGNVVIVFRSGMAAQVLRGSSASDHECSVDGSELSCSIGALPAGAHEYIEIDLAAATPGVVSLQATAWASNDTNPANNLAVRALELQPAVVLALAVQPETIALGAGDTAPVEISIRNDSTLDATSVEVEISSPFPISDFEPAGACTRAVSAAPLYRCALDSLRSRDSRVVRGVVHAPAELASGQPASGLLSASASAAEPTANAGSNVASAVVAVYSAVVDLESVVTSAPASAVAGSAARVTVRLRNVGPDTASDARLEIGFAPQLAVVDLADDRAACAVVDDNAVHCATAALATGESMEVEVEIVPAVAGVYAWTVAASHSGFDPNGANDALERTLQVTAPASAPAQPSASAGGGGGGASWLLLALAAFGLRGRRAVCLERNPHDLHRRAGSQRACGAGLPCAQELIPACAWPRPTAGPSPRA